MEHVKNISERSIKKRMLSSPKERIVIFREIPVSNRGFFLLTLSKHLQVNILESLNDKEIIEFLHYLDPDEVTDLLQVIGKQRRERIIKRLSLIIRERVEFLLTFNPKTAAGIMSLDYVEIKKNSTFGTVSKAIQGHERRTGRFPTLLVVEKGILLGELPAHALIIHHKDEKIAPCIRHIPSIQYDKDKDEVIAVFRSHPHDKIIVLDDKQSILGIIYSDDMLRTLEDRPVKGLYDFAGVRSEESVHDSVFTKVKHRYRWLILNLATAFLAASVVNMFQETIQAFVLLAVYMPIVAGMGGNTGTQTLAVMVRGIALKEIDLKSGKNVIAREVGAGFVNGMINGVLVAIIASLFNHNPLLGFIVGLSMVVNLMIAGFFGSTIPLIMKWLGKDPATSAAIFITTATDVFGFFVFLGMASILL